MTCLMRLRLTAADRAEVDRLRAEQGLPLAVWPPSELGDDDDQVVDADAVT